MTNSIIGQFANTLNTKQSISCWWITAERPMSKLY